MLDTSTMPSTIMAKNYSHCPLKKRPIQYIKEEIEPVITKIEITDDQPENLSTKPEDVNRRINSTSSSTTSSPPPTPIEEKHHVFPEQSQQPSSPVSSATASPLFSRANGGAFHRVQPVSPEPLHYAPTTWHRNVAPQSHIPVYPQTYFPISYPYGNEFSSYYSLYSPTSSYGARDSSCSPPQVVPHQRQPLAPLALIPEPRRIIAYDRSSLSPASSTGAISLRSHSPASSNEPADLSPPPSVTSLPANRVNSTRHQCPDCGKSYSTFSGLAKHRQYHCAHGDGPKRSFSCKYCQKVYVSLGALKMHIRTHTLPCKCTTCGKAFSRPWLLQGHIRTHTGEKPFSCQHCNRAFADRSNLRAHLQTHSDVKKYSCNSCSKTFSRMSLLTKHAESGCSGGGSTPIYTQAHLEQSRY